MSAIKFTCRIGLILLLILASVPVYGTDFSLSAKSENVKNGQRCLDPILFLLTGANALHVSVTASSFENITGQYHPPYHAYDRNFATRWSAEGSGEWIQFAFSQEVIVDEVAIAFHRGDERISDFSITVSENGTTWTEVYAGQSSGVSTSLESFSFSEVLVSYVRIIGFGNSLNDWNSYSEVVFPSLQQATCSDGLNNQNESGIDCGGVCGGDCCSNGHLDTNLGETGIDCGGICRACYLGTTYYVSASSGDDSNDGLTPDRAWQTIAKVNDTSLQAGDAVLFKSGDTWREELRITWSGTANNHITFSSFGSGNKPRILASELASNWSPVAGHPNVFRSSSPLSIPMNGKPASIFFGELDGSTTWGRVQSYSSVNSCGTSYSMLQQEYDWCWDGAINVYSPAHPGTRYSFIEVPQRRGSITMLTHDPKEFITVDGLEMMYGTMYGYNDGWPMDYEVRGLTIRNNHIGYIGIRGGDSAMGLVIWHSDMLVQNNDIHDCGRRSISYNVYTDNGRSHSNLVFENVVFAENTLHNGYHTTGFDISHGDVEFDTFRNFIFRNNFIYDDPNDNPADGVNDFTSMGLYLHPGNGIFSNFKIHNNVLKYIKQKGLAISDVHGLEIFNNVFYGMNPNIGSFRSMVQISGDYQNVKFNNNIVFGTVSKTQFDAWGVLFNNGQAGISSLDNNLYYQQDGEQVIIFLDESYKMSEWQEYRAERGRDLNSPTPQNPLFVDPENDDFNLLPGSPAINQGVDIGLPYNGSAPDLGAFESEVE